MTGCAATCGACAAQAVQRRLVARLGNGVHVVRCANCGVTSLYPQPSPDELSRHYESYYLTRTNDTVRQARLVQLHRQILDYLVSQASSSPSRRLSFLDYGCGGGAFLRCVAMQGHLAVGTDVSTQNLRQLREAARHDNVVIELLDLSTSTLTDFGSRRFDVVTLFQVIEHIRNPLDLVSSLAGLQQAGGLLYIECPNDAGAWVHIKNPAHRLLRSNSWHSLKYPEHLHGFTRRSIASLLAAANYGVVNCGDYAYRDGLHQVESEFWWPRLRSNGHGQTPMTVMRSAIPLIDQAMSAFFRAGSGLYALGRKRPTSSVE
jgi:2-polyprenyl-3-methyl-5-hydroxy-6-metoxy-1,4-benzoquinol methylase